MDPNEAIAAIDEDVRVVSRKLARNWEWVTTLDDAYQELMVRVLEQNLLLRLADMTGDERRIILSKIAGRNIERERADLLYFSGQYRYGTQEVYSLLKAGVLSEAKTAFSAERMDVELGISALRKKNARHTALIWRRYVDNETLEGGDRDAAERAVSSLTGLMNYVHQKRSEERATKGGPGSRKAISNAKAEFVSRAAYSGDDSDPEGVTA